MSIERTSAPVDIAVSGLRVQALRMNVIATNIANANTTRTASGQVYRRQDVQVKAVGGRSGVTVARVVQDQTGELKRVLMPGHPDADANGYVKMPNVELPTEMIHLVTASRAYQANAAVMKRYQDLTEATLDLIR
jgi:flagellar basal-body rod protein FlgC